MGTRRVILAEGYKAFGERKKVRWTRVMREAFLDHLAATCNVRASAAFAGVEPVSVYVLRRREPAFADAWGEALAMGYEMLETLLVGQALAGDTSSELTTGANLPSGPIAVELALKLLTMHRAATGKPKRTGPRPQFAEVEQTDMALMAKLAQIEARRQPALPAPTLPAPTLPAPVSPAPEAEREH